MKGEIVRSHESRLRRRIFERHQQSTIDAQIRHRTLKRCSGLMFVLIGINAISCITHKSFTPMIELLFSTGYALAVVSGICLVVYVVDLLAKRYWIDIEDDDNDINPFI